MNLFKVKSFFLKIEENRIELTDLNSGESIKKESLVAFSDAKHTLADVPVFQNFIKPLADKLLPKDFLGFMPSSILVVQLNEKNPEGITDNDVYNIKTCLLHIFNVKNLQILQSDMKLTNEEILSHLKNSK